MSAITTFFSKQSRKSWVGGIAAAAVTPILQLVAEGGHYSLNTVINAVASGLVTAFGVYQTTNEKDPAALTAEQQRMQQAVDSAVAAVKAVAPAPVVQKVTKVATTADHLLEEATKDFGGQSVTE